MQNKTLLALFFTILFAIFLSIALLVFVLPAHRRRRGVNSSARAEHHARIDTWMALRQVLNQPAPSQQRQSPQSQGQMRREVGWGRVGSFGGASAQRMQGESGAQIGSSMRDRDGSDGSLVDIDLDELELEIGIERPPPAYTR